MISGPITSRQRWSFSAWVARQPVKLGGMGLRSFEELCQPAYLGAMEQALPRLHTGFCKVLEDVVGGDDAFGEAASGDGRWRTLLASGSRVGEEFGTAWRCLQGEAEAAAAWLGEEVEGPLATDVNSAGDGSTSGKTRSALVENREKVLGKLLLESLSRLPNKPSDLSGAGQSATNCQANFSLLCLATTLLFRQKNSLKHWLLCSALEAQPVPLKLGKE